MNFVIFSYNFLPLKDAESWCTARFAGALAYCGHNVHVVTMDHPGTVSSVVFDLLVGPKVKITRVPVRVANRPLGLRLRYVTFEWEAVNFTACRKAVRAALAAMPDAVLVTRSNPLASTIVGWHCRKYARKWVAHLSDPIPIPGRETSWRSTHRFANRFWMKRTLRDADVVSVTCPNAIRAYRDAYGAQADAATFIVTPHIGEPALPVAGKDKNARAPGPVRIVHHGVMCEGRGAPELAAAVRQLNAEGIACEFVQCGQVDDVADVFAEGGFVRREDACMADIEYVPDLRVPLPYCPFLSSKFVYRLFDDVPMLVYTQSDSFAASFAQECPNGGVWIATDARSLVECLRALICGGNKGLIERGRARSRFERKRVVNDFEANIQ